MRHRGRLLLAISIIGILSSVVLPNVNAETFDIGTKISESDLYIYGEILYFYDSGSTVATVPDYIDNITSILDGDENTGIYLGPDDEFGFELIFPYPLYVDNITVKPSFGGNATKYYLMLNPGIIYMGPTLAWGNSTQQTFQVNANIMGFLFTLKNDSPDNSSFNDVIINYTPGPTNLTDVIASISVLTNTVNSLQNQINNLNQQIVVMNNTINSLNQNQIQILNDLTTLQSNYNQLNDSLMNLFDELENLNITTSENITLLKENLNLIESNINNIYLSIENLTTNVSELSELQDLIDQTTQDIIHLNENITEIKNSMPSEYDDTTLTTRVFQLESENAALSDQIQNLTEEIEELKDNEDEDDDFMPIGAYGLGFLGILIAIVAVILATRKSDSRKPAIEEENPETESSSEDNSDK